jgi:hypothetical protein
VVFSLGRRGPRRAVERDRHRGAIARVSSFCQDRQSSVTEAATTATALEPDLHELFAVVLLLLAFACGGAIFLVPWETLATASAWLLAAGAALGVPTGVLYHLRLARALSAKGLLPEGWYWRPLKLHPLLDEGRERTWVLIWCTLGALGFLVMVLGLIALAAAAVLVFVRPDGVSLLG